MDIIKKYFDNDTSRVIFDILDDGTQLYITKDWEKMEFKDRFPYILAGDLELLKVTSFPDTTNNIFYQCLMKNIDKKIADAIQDHILNEEILLIEQSAYMRPRLLSDAMCNFLEVSLGSRSSITDVTRMVQAYIKMTGLKSTDDTRRFHMDDYLRKILYTDEETVSYFQLQPLLKPHFLK